MVLGFYTKEIPANSKVTTGQDGGKESKENDDDGKTENKTSRCSDRSKVTKPPADNKRPPSLMQTACAYTQTGSIYTDPRAEVTKAAEKSKAATGEYSAHRAGVAYHKVS